MVIINTKIFVSDNNKVSLPADAEVSFKLSCDQSVTTHLDDQVMHSHYFMSTYEFMNVTSIAELPEQIYSYENNLNQNFSEINCIYELNTTVSHKSELESLLMGHKFMSNDTAADHVDL